MLLEKNDFFTLIKILVREKYKNATKFDNKPHHI